MRLGIEVKENPKTIQEKLIWLQFYDKANWLKPICADKLKVREYVKEKIGKDICVPLLNVYDSLNDIKLEELPDQFVLKTNHASAQYIICKNKKAFNIEEARKKLKIWLSKPYGISTCEPHYFYIERKCFAEKLLKTSGQNDIVDYKFLCFNGKPKLMQLIQDRHGPERRLQHYDMNKKFVNVHRADFKCRPELKHKDILPVNFDLMKEYAEKLAAPFKFVRVDFYEVNGVVYLGEMTFVPAAARFSFTEPKFALEMGSWLKL